jgi:hypothetical protein
MFKKTTLSAEKASDVANAEGEIGPVCKYVS